ncbi:hypothetical protein [Parvularcula sp. IMCC14364]|uniref:hypothetical protein n=1 Tax=Parvularcula sp. IMCC14364 TaxID=3067902 RepID=UPI0027406379|nr:hypothetical protein [Parvularcula sp. IMCC14364]
MGDIIRTEEENSEDGDDVDDVDDDIDDPENNADDNIVNYDSIDAMEFNDHTVLSPGVYCGGINIGQNIQVEFEPGTYIIQDGPFIVDRNSHVNGEGVGFYFTGENSYFNFLAGSAVTFTAPETGDFAGMLFMEDRNKPARTKFIIARHLTDELLGTIYLPRSRIIVQSPSSVGQDSAYTVIVAWRIHVGNRSSLFLNSDYSATDVPVPEGVGPVNGSIYLTN